MPPCIAGDLRRALQQDAVQNRYPTLVYKRETRAHLRTNYQEPRL